MSESTIKDNNLNVQAQTSFIRNIDSTNISWDQKLKDDDINSSIKEDKYNEYSVVSLFSGCGGMDLGFRGGFNFLGTDYERHPFDIKWANEINASACRTYIENIGSHIHQGDVWRFIEDMPDTADVMIGGFPCQDISVNGKGTGVSGSRSGLYLAMVEAVRRVRPKVFVAENVKGLLMRHHEKSLEKVINEFRALGYNVPRPILYNSADYGVPQTRERVFLVGYLPNVAEFVPPTATHEPQNHVTARAALSDLAGMPEDVRYSHIWSRAKRSPEQGNRKLVASRPGYTIRAECHGNIQWHYDLPRRISMREAARIQSFPDEFVFVSKLRETERQIGNAVPPVLAWHIARAIAQMLAQSR